MIRKPALWFAILALVLLVIGGLEWRRSRHDAARDEAAVLAHRATLESARKAFSDSMKPLVDSQDGIRRELVSGRAARATAARESAETRTASEVARKASLDAEADHRRLLTAAPGEIIAKARAMGYHPALTSAMCQ